MNQAKPFDISKQVVWEAYKRVKSNQGAAGVDQISIQEFEKRLKDNLYKLWNRMSSGSYFPPPVRAVQIPKKDGSKRPLGIPTVADRTAQMVVKMMLEPRVEPYFHPDSCGYRPKKSAIEAVGKARQRCWQYAWVLDVDIKGFFDNLDHELLMKAVRKHTDSKWILLYIERWLKAPLQLEDGTRVNRDKGTPQGGVISPLLSNIFLHYAFDLWMKKHHSEIVFERYADDIVVHCRTEEEAIQLNVAIHKRFQPCKLEIHPEKTKIVYCQDDQRQGQYPNTRFDFLGYTFRPRESRSLFRKYCIRFLPAISNESATKMRHVMRKWRLQLWSDQPLEVLATKINPIIRGWINYYGKYYKSELRPVFNCLNNTLARWATRKYKRFNPHHPTKAIHWLGRIAKQNPNLFAHWAVIVRPAVGQ